MIKLCLGKLKEEKYSLIVIFIILLLFIMLSWNKNMIVFTVDNPKEFVVPYFINNGKVLYKEIISYYGPLIPYIIAFITKIFGLNFATVQSIGICLTLIFSYLIYFLSRQILGKFESCFVSLLFLGQLAFSNLSAYIIPFSFNALFGELFFIVITFLLIIHLKNNNKYCLYISAVLYVLIFFIKQDYFISTTLLMILYFVFKAFTNNSPDNNSRINLNFSRLIHQIPFKDILSFSIIVIVMLMVGLVISIQIFGYKDFLACMFPFEFYNSVSMQYFFGNKHRLHFTPGNIMYSLLIDIIVFSLFLLVTSAIYLFKKSFNLNSVKTKKEFLYTIIKFFFVLIFLIIALNYNNNFVAISIIDFFIHYSIYIYSGINLVLLIWLIYLFVKSDIITNQTLIILIMASFVLSFRSWLFLTLSEYGLYFLPLAIILFVYFLVKVIPEIIIKFFKINKEYWNFSARIFLILLTLSYFSFDIVQYSITNKKITTPLGDLYSFNEPLTLKNLTLIKVSEYVKRNSNPNDSIQALPNLSLVYVYSNRLLAAKFFEAFPGVISSKTVEMDFIKELEKNKPLFILISNDLYPSFNTGVFGSDSFNPDIYQWIVKNYHLVKTFGGENKNPLKIKIFKRNH